MQPASPQPLALLRQVAAAIEELLLAGTTTASQSTQRTLNAAFEEASRAGFLRLGASMRIVLEELKRLDADPMRFSGSRLAFFLDRGWLLARGTLSALEQADQQALNRLTAAPQSLSLDQVEVATLGVLKRHVPGAFSAFEFRLRLLQAVGLPSGAELSVGTPLTWSLVVPAKAGLQVPPEAFLHLPQKQGFKATDLLQKQQILIDRVRISDSAPHRLTLGPDSKLKLGEAVSDWRTLVAWQPRDWLARLESRRPDPLELAIEFSEEVLLSGWRMEQDFAPSSTPGRELTERSATIRVLGMSWRLRVDVDESPLEQALRDAAAADSPPDLYASVHVEHGQAVLSPLGLLSEQPEYITISPAKIDKAALVRALNGR